MVKEDVKEPGAVTVSLSNLSHPIELQEQAVAQVQEPESPEIVVLSDDLPECVFSATQPSSDHVDIVVCLWVCAHSYSDLPIDISNV